MEAPLPPGTERILGRGGEAVTIDGFDVVLPTLTGNSVWQEMVLDGGAGESLEKLKTEEYPLEESAHGMITVTIPYNPVIAAAPDAWAWGATVFLKGLQIHVWDTVKVQSNGAYHKILFPYTIGQPLVIIAFGVFALLAAVGLSILLPSGVTSWQLSRMTPAEAVAKGPAVVASASKPIADLTGAVGSIGQGVGKAAGDIGQGAMIALIVAAVVLVLMFSMRAKALA